MRIFITGVAGFLGSHIADHFIEQGHIVVGCDNEKTGRTWDQWLKSAAAWVRYSNQVKHYGVRYWEIGNENWNGPAAPPAQS